MLENSEKEKVPGQALELLKLDQDHEDALRVEIERHDGLVRIFIHPLAHEYIRDITGGSIENHERVYKILGRTMTSENSPPIFIFENEQIVTILWKPIANRLKPPKDFYVIPTLLDYPYPVMTEGLEIPRDGKVLTDEALPLIESEFKKLIELFLRLGIKKVLVGGTSLEIRGDQITRCVGNFLNMMRIHSNIETKLSLGTAPVNREDVRGIQDDLL